MKSFKQLYQRLPTELIDKLSNEYSPSILNKILNGYMAFRPVTIRINTLKTDVRTVMEILRKDNIKFDRVLWYNDALIIKNKKEKDLENHDLYQKGHIYLQSLSSMIPPLVLKPKPGIKVLDLTAAPGSKSTQLATLMNNQGYILANEVNAIRAERLKFNIDRQGAEIIEVRVGDGKKLEERWNEYFDAVLLDAPCSGTGIISVNDSKTYRYWSEKLVNKLIKEQRKLLESGLRVLKPGGTLLYSTCSILKEENEENVYWFLEKYPDLISVEKINFTLNHSSTILRETEEMLLIIPTELFEGFFVAKFRKKSG